MILLASLVAAGAVALACTALGVGRPAPRSVATVTADGTRRTGHRRVARLAAATVLWLIAWVADPMLALLLAATRLAWPRLRARRDARRRAAEIERALPDSIELLTLVVHAGLTPAQAIGLLARLAPPPTRPAFTEVVRRTERGQPLPDALRAIPDVLGTGAASAADALALAERHGAPIGPTLEQLGHDARQRRHRRAEALARRLPVRLSFPLVVCTLPSFVLVAIAPAVLAALSSLGDTVW